MNFREEADAIALRLNEQGWVKTRDAIEDLARRAREAAILEAQPDTAGHILAEFDIANPRAGNRGLVELARDVVARCRRAEKTVDSLACMLGWGNTPPREVLERSVRELRRGTLEANDRVRKAITLAAVVRRAYERDDPGAMRLFGSNIAQMLAHDVEHAGTHPPTTTEQPKPLHVQPIHPAAEGYAAPSERQSGSEEDAMEFIDIVLDGPPGPEGGRFVEVEDPAGRSIKLGEWVERGGGLWALRIPLPVEPKP